MSDSDNKPVESMLFNSLKLVFGSAVRGVWLGEVTGLENVPQTGSAIIASNHASYLDFLLLSAVSPRQLQFMAGEVFYNNFFLQKSFERMGYIQVSRGVKGNVSALRKAVRKLEQGNIVAIYPEGRRSGNGKLQKARSGVGFLAVETEAPVIPVFIEGTSHAWSRHSRFPSPYKCTIRIGEPLRFCKPSDKEQRKNCIHAATHEIMLAIARLGDAEYPWEQRNA
jgi:1-acyl-sn-glycerol-3-phosphate acyltransferase